MSCVALSWGLWGLLMFTHLYSISAFLLTAHHVLDMSTSFRFLLDMPSQCEPSGIYVL